MIHAAVFLLSLGAFAALLLASPRRQPDWFRRKLALRTARILRLTGVLFLASAFIVASVGFGWGYGAVAWFGWLTVAAALVVAANTNRERTTRMRRP